MLLPCVTAAGCAAIGEFLRRDRRIKVVTLSGNSINDEGEHSQHARLQLAASVRCGPAAICRSMGSNQTNLLVSACLCSVLSCTRTASAMLTKPCGCCCAPGMALIASGLASNGTLLSLDVSDNHVSSVGAIDLAEALHSDKCKVAQLLLHNNRIGMAGSAWQAVCRSTGRQECHSRGIGAKQMSSICQQHGMHWPQV